MPALGIVATPAPTFVTNERGGPVPPSDVVKRLAALPGGGFGLRFMADLDRSRWAVTRDWVATDHRWAWVQRQEVSRESAYDIIGYLPLDCPADQAAAYIERAFKAYPKEEIQKLAQSVAHWNEVEIPKQQTAQLVTDTLDTVNQQHKQQNPRRTRVAVPKGT